MDSEGLNHQTGYNRAEHDRMTRIYSDALARAVTDFYTNLAPDLSIESAEGDYVVVGREEPMAFRRASTIDFLGDAVPWREELFLTLSDAYDALIPSTLRICFRIAVGDALLEISREPDLPAEAARQLIHLVKSVGAVEAIDSFLAVVGSTTITDEHPMVLFSIMGALGSLVPARDVGRVTSVLVELPGFDDRYLFLAVKIVVQCDPSVASGLVGRHMERLAGVREQAWQRGQLPAFDRQAWIWVQDVIAVAGIAWLADVWERSAAGAPEARLLMKIMGRITEPDSIEAGSLVIVHEGVRQELKQTDANERLGVALTLNKVSERSHYGPATKGLGWN